MENTLPTVPNPSKIRTLISRPRAWLGIAKTKFLSLPREFKIPAGIGLVIFFAGLIFYFASPLFRSFLQRNLGPQNIWTPPDAPVVLGGAQSYSINGGTKDLPQITNLTLNPQDAKQGLQQTVSVTVTNATPVKEVIVILHLDNDRDPEYRLKLAEGTALDGVWKQTYTFPWTYNTSYRVTVKARNEQGLGNMTTISIR